MKEKNPWITLTSKNIYDNPWINVKEHKVLTPTGTDGMYSVVSFKNYAIGIIPIDEDGNTYLVGQYRYPLELYSWEIPMGGGLKSNSPIESAKRELKEETGLVAESWEEIMTIHTSNSVTDETGYIFIARDLTQKKAEPEDTEELKVMKVSMKEAYEMTMRGEITDAISVAGILKAWVLINS